MAVFLFKSQMTLAWYGDAVLKKRNKNVNIFSVWYLLNWLIQVAELLEDVVYNKHTPDSHSFVMDRYVIFSPLFLFPLRGNFHSF